MIICSSKGTRAQLNVELLDHWTDTTIALAVEDARYSDLWGFTIKGQRYCAVGSSEGIEILEVNKNSLRRVDRKPGAFQGYTVVHRDMKTYKNYLYAVGDEGTASLQIFDLSFLPDSMSKVYDSNAFFTVCHNIFIDTITAKLYACGPNNTGMKVLDISDPVNPVLLHDFNAVNYVHDCYVREDTAYLNCGFDGLHIYDFSSSTPVQLGVLDFYANQGYNHSGWLSPDSKKYAFVDETQGTKIKLCEIDQLAQIEVSATFGTRDFSTYTPHNIVLLNKLAVVAYYNEGLRIFDISRQPISEIGHYDTFLEETAYKMNGAWGVYVFEANNQILISDRQNGIYLFSFPLDIMEADSEGTFVTNTPFLDENSRIITKDYFKEPGLTFSIVDLNGKILYRKASLMNWIHVPLSLPAGMYAYAIYNSDQELISSGKFVKAN
ncbi:MAG: choice-of-anchor B family protein [Crocinitomicaceae bacterium]